MQPPDVAHRFHVALQQRADKLLVEARSPTPDGVELGRPELQLIERPAFGDWVSRTVFSQKRPGRATVRRHTWLRSKTFALVSGRILFLEDQIPEPLFDVREGVVPLEDWNNQVALGRSLQLSPVPPSVAPFGVDGTTFSAEFSFGFVASRFQWWQGGPAEWASLIEWTHHLATFCDRVVDREASTSHSPSSPHHPGTTP